MRDGGQGSNIVGLACQGAPCPDDHAELKSDRGSLRTFVAVGQQRMRVARAIVVTVDPCHRAQTPGCDGTVVAAGEATATPAWASTGAYASKLCAMKRVCRFSMYGL